MAISVADNFSYQGTKPLDARIKYDSVANMKAAVASTLYDGCLAYVTATQKYYTYDSTNDTDPTTGKWRELQTGGGGSSENYIGGYYKAADGKFYEESTYTTEITGDTQKLYVSLDTNVMYRYTGLAFVEVSSDTDTTIQVLSLPTAASALEGKIYQYIGATGNGLTNGYFYKCVSDGAVSPTYSWVAIDVEQPEIVEISSNDFDQLSPSEKDNGQAYFIPDRNVVSGFMVMGNRFDKANIYTETERMVGSWMGKPLYQKTCIGNTSDTLNTPSEIARFSGIDKIWIKQGFFEPVGYSIQLNDSSNSSTDDLAKFLNRSYLTTENGNKVLYMLVGTENRLNVPVYITVQYTKTGDATVNIGTGNDYSTDEQIIGTWIDGKPLYQKTVNYNTIITVTSTPQNISIADVSGLNIDNLIYYTGTTLWGTNNVPYKLPFLMAWPSVTIYVDVVLNDTKDTLVLRPYRSSGETTMNSTCVTIQYTKTTD